jgi:3-dehydroquinate synthase
MPTHPSPTPYLTVRAPDAQYPIYLESGSLAALPGLLAARNATGKVAIVTNEVLHGLYGESLHQILPDAVLISIPEGEQHKNLDTVRALYDQFIAAGLDRRSTVIAFGGGVVGDTVGFAAASFLRGVAFVQIPTSLLAMIDSSVGGKVGVDLPQGKNLVGAFKQPLFVLIDPNVLTTLPDSEWRAGLAEVIKVGLIRQPALLNAALYQRGNEAAFVGQAIAIKASVVEEDPYESGLRAILNLGHTFGHALETVSAYRWPHGQAVAVGLVGAVMLSAKLGLCAPDLVGQVETLLMTVGLPTRYEIYDPAALYAAMGADKKKFGGQIRFILMRAAGEPVLQDGIPAQTVIDVWAHLRQP